MDLRKAFPEKIKGLEISNDLDNQSINPCVKSIDAVMAEACVKSARARKAVIVDRLHC